MPEVTDIVTLAKLSVDLQTGIPRVRRLLDDLGIHPVLRINGVPYFDAAISDRLFPLLRKPTEDSHE